MLGTSNCMRTPRGLCQGPARKGGRATYVLLRGLQTSRCLLGAHWGRVCCWQLAGRLQHPFDCPRPVVKHDVRIFFQGVTAQAGPQGPVLKSDSSSMIHPRKKPCALGQGGHWQRCPGDVTAKTRCPRPGVKMKLRVLVCNNHSARHVTKTAQARTATETTHLLPDGSETKGWRRFCVCECGGHKGSPTSHSQIFFGLPPEPDARARAQPKAEKARRNFLDAGDSQDAGAQPAGEAGMLHTQPEFPMARKPLPLARTTWKATRRGKSWLLQTSSISSSRGTGLPILGSQA